MLYKMLLASIIIFTTTIAIEKESLPNRFTATNTIRRSDVLENFDSLNNKDGEIIDTLKYKYVRFTSFKDSTILKIVADTLYVDTLYSDAGKIIKFRGDTIVNKVISGDSGFYGAFRVTALDSFYNIKGYYSKRSTNDTIRNKLLTSDSIYSRTRVSRKSRSDTLDTDTLYSDAGKIIKFRGDTIVNKVLTSDSIYSRVSKYRASKIDSLEFGFGNTKICTYAETTWIDSVSGLVVVQPTTIRAVKVGSMITMCFSDVVIAPNDGDSLRINGILPTKLRPVINNYIKCFVVDTIDYTGVCNISNNGSISFAVHNYYDTHSFLGHNPRGFRGVSLTYISATNTW
jgi:hypothetical protein